MRAWKDWTKPINNPISDALACRAPIQLLRNSIAMSTFMDNLWTSGSIAAAAAITQTISALLQVEHIYIGHHVMVVHSSTRPHPTKHNPGTHPAQHLQWEQSVRNTEPHTTISREKDFEHWSLLGMNQILPSSQRLRANRQ